jgi:hypothetical protein
MGSANEQTMVLRQLHIANRVGHPRSVQQLRVGCGGEDGAGRHNNDPARPHPWPSCQSSRAYTADAIGFPLLTWLSLRGLRSLLPHEGILGRIPTILFISSCLGPRLRNENVVSVLPAISGRLSHSTSYLTATNRCTLSPLETSPV